MELRKVFVTVGTTRFDKLIASVSRPDVLKILRDRGCEELVLQIGAGVEPNIKGHVKDIDIQVRWYRFKPSLSEEIAQADLVIAHAGAGTCLEVLSANKVLLVVANDDLMGSHQDELATKFHSLNYLAYTASDKLAQALYQLQPNALDPYIPGDPSAFASFIDSFFGFQS